MIIAIFNAFLGKRYTGQIYKVVKEMELSLLIRVGKHT